MRKPGNRRATVQRAAVLVTAATILPAAVAFAASGSGAPGIGDPYYPEYGNGGYDVSHYGIDVGFDPDTELLTGTTTIDATATQDLSRFNLDFVLHAQRVTVNGRPAHSRASDPHELTVRPAQPIARGQHMTVVVEYAGVPSKVPVDGISPWVTTADGAVAVGEPEISAWWFPGNDHPRDKATYAVKVTVPGGLEAIGNGRLASHTSRGGEEVWRWRERQPMATYLAFMAIGQFDIFKGTTARGTPWLTAVASNGGPEGEFARADLARTPEVISWLSRQWGPYPFDSIGGVAPKADFGFALENQTRPVYTRGFWRNGSNIYVVVHENAHEWYGDSVSVRNWRDIWLNEGFASFAEWLWSEQHGDGSAQSLFDSTYASHPAGDEFWRTVIGNPGAHNEFDGAVYDRGAMTLQALRNRIGDPAFFQLMRDWAAAHRYANGAVTGFTRLAERVSGEQLDGFFDAWLYSPTRPAATKQNGFPPAMGTAMAPKQAPASLVQIRRTNRLLHAER